MTDPLLVLDIDIKIANEYNAAIRPNAFTPPAEFAGLHVTLHNVDAILLIKGDAGDLVKADDIILADEAAFACAIINKHTGYCGFTAGNEMSIG